MDKFITETEIQEYMNRTGFCYADAKRALEEDTDDFMDIMQHYFYG